MCHAQQFLPHTCPFQCPHAHSLASHSSTLSGLKGGFVPPARGCQADSPQQRKLRSSPETNDSQWCWHLGEATLPGGAARLERENTGQRLSGTSSALSLSTGGPGARKRNTYPLLELPPSTQKTSLLPTRGSH